MKALNKIKKLPLLSTISAVFVALLLPCISYAADPIVAGASAAKGDGQPLDLFGSTGIFTTISNVMLFIVGALSVLMLIVGGLRYVVSGGNATAITSAKNTVLYAIVGLIVALLAFAAINFVLTTLTGGVGTGATNL